MPALASEWSKDKDPARARRGVAARRVPVADAQKQIRDYAAGADGGSGRRSHGDAGPGLFDHMNAERSQVISGIARYAAQPDRARSAVRKEAPDVDALRANPMRTPTRSPARTDRLTWETRIFEERVQSLTYVCEVPTLIEQRLYRWPRR